MGLTMRALAAALPDIPRLVETRAMLLSGACEVLGEPEVGRYVVRSLDAALAAVVGRPAPALIREAAERHSRPDVLAGDDSADYVRSALPRWVARRAIVHALDEAQSRTTGSEGADVRLIADGERISLTHVPRRLREEIESARRRSPFTVAFVDGRAVSFAYVPWQTETLCDLSIDTLAPYRGRGLGAATAGRLVHHVQRQGKHPVWGAVESNTASLRLAARLGFRPVDRLFVFSAHRLRSGATDDA